MSIVTVHGGHTMYFNGTATVGTPGTFSNAPIPANFNDLQGTTPSPATAWTTGQHVVLGDSSLAWWTGTAWATGSNVVPAFTAETPPATGTVGVAYAGYQFAASGDPEVYSVSDGALPDGLTLSSTGALAGTPTVADVFTFKVLATAASGTDETADIVITVS